MEPLSLWLNSYLGRLTGYAVVAIIASLIGSFAVGPDSTWQQPTPFSALIAAVFSLGPALVILAIVRLPTLMMIGLSLLSAVGLIVMWRIFAQDESSTAAFIFFSGWLVGIPIATAVTIGGAVLGYAPRQVDDPPPPLL